MLRPDEMGEGPMADPEIVALRTKLTSRHAPTIIGNAAATSMNVALLMGCGRT